ncbi:phage tail assembly chaperone [uncultured Oscillibacter sp.]|jgi:hypothetical protein|uniref:phage tail assembly chaperone n=1 Tax=uncultured Oscillibacter sp. TaxID=876091 RepID=UPI0025D3E5A9|nr:hypothetical protein [uncultured Oscillibacter sp.]
MENEKKVSVLDLLLRPELPDVRRVLPEKQVEVKRLTELAGEPVVFTLRAMTYNETRQLYDKPREDQALSAVLYGCKDPDFRDKRLLDSEKGIVTPLDAIKARLFAGEIDELHIEIQKLSGYLRRTLAEVKNA